MGGLVGCVDETGADLGTTFDRMCETVRHTNIEQVDRWTNDFAKICLVHHGIRNVQSQPIFNEDKTLFIVMEGEVFDYDEQKTILTRQGHAFKFDDNDAEFCLHLYEEKGENAFKDLNGSYCIVIGNLMNHDILLVTDRFSSYPIFYSQTDNGALFFGTQFSSVIQSSDVRRQLDMTAVMEFFSFRRVLGTKTYYKDVKSIAPATVLRYSGGNLSSFRYWRIQYRKRKGSSSYYAYRLAEAIRKAVERRTRDHLRYGILLSGGLDSRTVLAASESNIRVAFTIADFENREVKIAKRIAETKGCKHVFIERSINHYADIMDEAIELSGGLYPLDQAHFLGFFDTMRKECDVLFHGWMLDLLFQGRRFLPTRRLRIIGRDILSVLPKPLLVHLSDQNFAIVSLRESACQSMFHLGENPADLFRQPYASRLIETAVQSINDALRDFPHSNTQSCERHYNKWEYFELGNSPHKRFAFQNVLCLRPFMIERTIALDSDLFDLYLEMPTEIRIGNAYRKALRILGPRLADIPDSRTGLSPMTPKPIEAILCLVSGLVGRIHPEPMPHTACTQGAWPNFAELIRCNNSFQKIVETTIEDPDCLDPTIFDRDKIRRIFYDHIARIANHDQLLLLLVTFGKWYKKHGPKAQLGFLQQES